MVLVATRGVEPRPLLPSLFGHGRCSTDELCGRMSPPCGRAPQLYNMLFVNIHRSRLNCFAAPCSIPFSPVLCGSGGNRTRSETLRAL